ALAPADHPRHQSHFGFHGRDDITRCRAVHAGAIRGWALPGPAARLSRRSIEWTEEVAAQPLTSRHPLLLCAANERRERVKGRAFHDRGILSGERGTIVW